jgi:hypothetical protein
VKATGPDLTHTHTPTTPTPDGPGPVPSRFLLVFRPCSSRCRHGQGHQPVVAHAGHDCADARGQPVRGDRRLCTGPCRRALARRDGVRSSVLATPFQLDGIFDACDTPSQMLRVYDTHASHNRPALVLTPTQATPTPTPTMAADVFWAPQQAILQSPIQLVVAAPVLASPQTAVRSPAVDTSDFEYVRAPVCRSIVGPPHPSVNLSYPLHLKHNKIHPAPSPPSASLCRPPR